VFINTLTGIMHDYHRTVPMDALMFSYNDRHTTELAGLIGARMASAIETGQGRNWDEPKIMMLTGGDKISARLMRQDFVDFTPQFKLVVAGNHKPGLRTVNEAIRRRMNLVPWLVTIPPEERDPQLADKLKAEWPGILAWMIEGCLQWQRVGLAPPASVTEATEDYLEAQDVLGEFLQEKCVVDQRAVTQSSDLFAAWKGFCELRGEKPGHQRRFNDALEQKGFRREKQESAKVFCRLRLKTQDERDAEEKQRQQETAQKPGFLPRHHPSPVPY
jgi:putative DNA primase/helicase